jgi:hypothetical protein
LSRRVGRIFDATMTRFAIRLGVAVAVSAAIMLGAVTGLDEAGLSGDTASSALAVGAIAGGVGMVGYLAAARIAGLGEVRTLLGALRRGR